MKHQLNDLKVIVDYIFWLRLEGLLILALSVSKYRDFGGSWWWFAGLLFVFDLSILGYLKNPKLGAFLYNLGHSLAVPLLLMLFAHSGYHYHWFNFLLIWTSHIGLDRMLGYGLKYDDKFTHTHLGWIGRNTK